MDRRVGRETPQRLLALPLGADRLAASRLVGKHDGVDQALEEVALVRRRHPPRAFERLVGVEVLASPRQCEAALVIRADGAATFDRE
jgi:hypothetical protein